MCPKGQDRCTYGGMAALALNVGSWDISIILEKIIRYNRKRTNNVFP